jgi:hypothetical protein
MATGPAREEVTWAGELTVQALEQLAQSLANRDTVASQQLQPILASAPDLEGAGHETARLVLGQLTQVLAQRDRLVDLSKDLTTI